MEILLNVQRHKPALLRARYREQLGNQDLVNRPVFLENGKIISQKLPGDNRLVGPASPYQRPCSAPQNRRQNRGAMAAMPYKKLAYNGEVQVLLC